MKRQLISGFLGSLVVAVLLASCAVATLPDASASSASTSSRAVQSSSLWEPMDSFNSSVWNKANWTNGGMFNCGFLPDHINFSGGVMNIRLDNYSSFGKPYSSGEYRTNNTFSYGKFEVNMKAAKGNGLVTSFFTYTGSPWDEIDVEVLGKNTNQVQFNYFTSGQGGHEQVVNLGFDASAGFHKYMIQWGQGYINWYVDGALKATANSNIPTHPMQIMMNFWPGTGVDSWLNHFNYSGTQYAYYDYAQYFQ